MTRTILIFLFLFCCRLYGFSQYLWGIYPDTVIVWNYFDGDEFNGRQPDRDKWLTHLPWSRSVISQDIHYMDSNTWIADGYACFALKKEQAYYGISDWDLQTDYVKRNQSALRDGNQYRFEYSGGLLWSHRQFKYGYFEIRFKAEAGRGVWPAFWLYGGQPNNEIDFFELKGEKPKALHVDVHCPDGCSNYTTGWFGYRKAFGHWIKTKKAIYGTDNIVSGEWTPDHITWYLNGELIAYSKQSINIPMNLTFGTGIGKDNGPFGPGPDKNTLFPNVFKVDYVRIYTKPDYSMPTTVQAKQGVPVTISVMPLSDTLLSVRISGMKNADTAMVKISDIYDKLIHQNTITLNTEFTVSVQDVKQLLFQAEVKNHKITQSLNLSYEVPAK